MKKEFTATVYILEDQKVLFIYHQKLGKWLPPGGHMEENETPPEAARREVREETGLEIEFILQENVWIDQWNAHSFERPYFCLLEEIPPYKDKPAHQHMDLIYVARPIRVSSSPDSSQLEAMRWFTLSEIEQLKPNIEIFTETLQVVRHLFQVFADSTTAIQS